MNIDTLCLCGEEHSAHSVNECVCMTVTSCYHLIMEASLLGVNKSRPFKNNINVIHFSVFAVK